MTDKVELQNIGYLYDDWKLNNYSFILVRVIIIASCFVQTNSSETVSVSKLR